MSYGSGKYVPPSMRGGTGLGHEMPSDRPHGGGDRGGEQQGFRRGGNNWFDRDRQQSGNWNSERQGGNWNSERQGGNWNSERQGGSWNNKPEGGGRGSWGNDNKYGGGQGFQNGGRGGFQKSQLPEEVPLEDLFEQSGASGINFDKYNDIPVTVSGEGEIAQPFSVFEDLDPASNEGGDPSKSRVVFRGELMKNIQLCKYRRPTPVQQYAIPIASCGRDLMACAQTGSGKTAAFLLPCLNLIMTNPPKPHPVTSQQDYRRRGYPRVLVLAPTRELAVQINDEARKFFFKTPFRTNVVYGGVPFREQARKVREGCELLVACPGRLRDLIQEGHVSLEMIEHLVLDEADRMLDMGFEPQIREIVQRSSMPPPGVRQTLMFSATFADEVQKLASDFLAPNYVYLTVGRVGSTTDSIKQVIELVDGGDKSKREWLTNILRQKLDTKDGRPALSLVFVETRRDVDQIETYLDREFEGKVRAIHGDRLQHEREIALKAFREGVATILVATDVAARGLDIPNVQRVIQYDMPGEITDYVHRIGRTGRVGNTGVAISFFHPDKNRGLAAPLLELLEESKQTVPAFLPGLCQSYQSHRTRGHRFGGRDYREGGRRGGRGGRAGGRWGGSTGQAPFDRVGTGHPQQHHDRGFGQTNNHMLQQPR